MSSLPRLLHPALSLRTPVAFLRCSIKVARTTRSIHETPALKMPELTGNPNDHDPKKFEDSISGSCLCGSITVTITDKDLFTKRRGHLCNCSNCRKVAGSFQSSNLLIDSDKVKIDDRDGTLKYFEDKQSMSGNSVFRYFCGTDGK